MTTPIDIAMRSRNDIAHLGSTLRALAMQAQPFNLISFDNASTDGSRELVSTTASRIVDVPDGAYIPGRVLNRAMAESTSDIVVFLNADCEPFDENWLASLLQPFQDPRVGATFGRQLPRPDCLPLAAFDTEATYGDGSRQAVWRHCFSMASCAVRRSAWEQVQFDESLSYSEDIAWSWNLRQAGWSIEYVAESCVYHSHNYSREQWKKRQYGEGRAEAQIFSWSAWQSTFLRYSLLPFAKQVMRDLRHCMEHRQWAAITSIPGYRYAQMVGRRRGFLDGRRKSDHQTASNKLVESV